MTRIVYIGESESRDIVTPNGGIRAVKGEPVEVPAALAKSLLEQPIFKPAPTGKTKKEND